MSIPITDRREKLKQIKAFHQSTLDALGVPDAIVLSKLAYLPNGLSEKHIGFFENEIGSGKDVYIEFGDKVMEPELVPGFQKRDLLKWKYNPHFKEECPTSAPDPTSGNVRYFIPISELILVKKPVVEKIRTTQELKTERESTVSELANNSNDFSDPLTKEMTIRDYAAIHMRKPISNKKWLNDLILK